MKKPRGNGNKFIALLITALLGLGALEATAADTGNAPELMGVCATCHGDFGQGGARGKYPRLAGQSEKYLAKQLQSFRSRTRINIPMFLYTEERELSDEDIGVISAYLASIRCPPPCPCSKAMKTR